MVAQRDTSDGDDHGLVALLVVGEKEVGGCCWRLLKEEGSWRWRAQAGEVLIY